MRTLSTSPPRSALPTGILSWGRGAALCLFVTACLMVGYQSLDSYATVAPMSSAVAYCREVESILSSDEISPHTQQTLRLLPDATNGLGTSPRAWRKLTNDILGSPDLRSRYQILQYTYPTNGPMLELARQMCRDLSEFFDFADPEQVSPPIVVIGRAHSTRRRSPRASQPPVGSWSRPPEATDRASAFRLQGT
jgi:hypothetical protein